MASKIGTILSMIFVIFLFLFASDMMCLQFLYSDLDSKALSVSYLIAKNQKIDSSFISSIEQKYDIKFSYSGPAVPKYGEIVDFKISKTFDPIIISTTEMTVDVKRTAIIGFYD